MEKLPERKPITVQPETLDLLDDLYQEADPPIREAVESLSSGQFVVIHTTEEGEVDMQSYPTLDKALAFLRASEEDEDSDWEFRGIFQNGKEIKVKIKTTITVGKD